MAKCNHAGATCIIGDFWTCKTPGCENGPKPPKPETKTRQFTRPNTEPMDLDWIEFDLDFSYSGSVSVVYLADKSNGIFATARCASSSRKIWEVRAAPGYLVSWYNDRKSIGFPSLLSMGTGGKLYYRKDPTTAPAGLTWTYSVP
jgi:hypothetical protein